MLGEEPIAFRDTDGAIGIVGAYCAHRGDLYRVRAAVTTSAEADFHRLLAMVAEDLVAR